MKSERQHFDFDKIDWARRKLGLPEYATLEQIRLSFRRLSQQYHPDSSTVDNEQQQEEYKQITQAYNLLLEYCRNYIYSFKEEDVKRQKWDPDVFRHLNQFYDGWWGTIED